MLARRVLTAGLACTVVLVAGCKPTDSVQWGYRGNSMIQVYNPDNVKGLEGINAIPEPEPRDPYDPTFPMATEIHENVQVLTDLNALELARLMNAMTTWIAPEEGCAYCHNTENLADDSKYTKLVSRQMLRMTRDINANWKNHVAETGVTCWTCHRGQPVPSDIWFTTPPPRTPSAGVTGWKGGQNVGGVANNGNASLPYDPLTPFLMDDTEVRVQGTEVLPYGNRQSIKQAEWTYSLMMYMSSSLGVNCTYCHQTRAMGRWEESTPQRVTAWHGIRMVRNMNQEHLVPLKGLYPEHRLGPGGDAPKAACATCHKGTYKPLYGESMLGDYPSLRGVLAGRMSPDPTAGGTIPVAYVPDGAAPATMEERTRMAEALAAAEAEAASAAAEAEVTEVVAAAGAGEAAESAQPTADAEVVAAADADAASAPKSDDSAADAADTATAVAVPAGSPLAEARPERRSLLSALAFWASDRQPASPEAIQQADADMPEPAAAVAAPPAADTVPEPAAPEETGVAEERPEPRSLLSALAFWDVDRRPASAEAAQQAVAEAAGPIPAAALSLAGMSAPEIETLLTTLLKELRALRQELEQGEPATETALPGPEDAPAGDEPAETDSAEPTPPEEPIDDTPTATAAVEVTPASTPEADQVVAAADAASMHAGDLADEVEQLRAALEERSDRLEGAAATADALDEAEAKIVAMQARLDQETTALEQQLDVVRGQRDRIAEEVAADLRGDHASAMDDAEGQLAAMQVRLDQERTALSQQLEVVRAQRDEAQAAARTRIAEREHAAAIAAAERQIGAIEARLAQQTHALHQQLGVVRAQRDAGAAELAARVPADDHRSAVRAAERELGAYAARLAQQTHALDQQLEVVREQRDEAAAEAATGVSADEHRSAVSAAERQLNAYAARLAQQTHALGQQLGVVREQRDTAAAEVAERIPPREHAKAIAALEARIKAVRARLDQQTHALDQQLAVVRAQRDDIESVAAERIARLQAEHAEAIEQLEARIAAGDTRQDQEREALRQQLAVVREQRDAAEAETRAEIDRLQQRLADSRAAEEEARAAETEAEAAVAAEATQRALAETAAALGGEVTEDGVVLNLGGDRLRFASGSATLPAGELPEIDRAAKLLSERPELTARIEGHTDSVGSRALNQSLSRQRAEAVMAALVERGVDPSRLTAEGVGPDRPIADNATAGGRSQNRRVEIYVASREQVAEGSAGAN